MNINLNSIDEIPKNLLSTINRHVSIIKRYESLDQLLENKALLQVVHDLNNLCIENGVIGIHYTRAIRDEIETDGLVSSSGEKHREQFINKHGHHFTQDQIRKIHSCWNSYFNASQNQIRDNRINFNFTFHAFDNGGVDDLLKYFGGEQINMPLTNDQEISAVLQKLGEPLIVLCCLDVNSLATFCEIPWGKIWLSSCHTRINSKADRFDIDAYQQISVPARCIKNIIKAYDLINMKILREKINLILTTDAQLTENGTLGNLLGKYSIPPYGIYPAKPKMSVLLPYVISRRLPIPAPQEHYEFISVGNNFEKAQERIFQLFDGKIITGLTNEKILRVERDYLSENMWDEYLRAYVKKSRYRFKFLEDS